MAEKQCNLIKNGGGMKSRVSASGTTKGITWKYCWDKNTDLLSFVLGGSINATLSNGDAIFYLPTGKKPLLNQYWVNVLSGGTAQMDGYRLAVSDAVNYLYYNGSTATSGGVRVSGMFFLTDDIT